MKRLIGDGITTMIKIILTTAILIVPALASACFGGSGYQYGMMGYGGGSIFMILGGTVWVIVGILAGVWLWQNINRK
jgi:hypothetical protein